MKNTGFKVAQVVVGLPVEGPFDYAVNVQDQEQIALGQRVRIMFNRRRMVGYVVKLKQTSAFKRLNPILQILDETPALSPQALDLCEQFSRHYGCSLGEAIEAYLPKALRGVRATKIPIQNEETTSKAVGAKCSLIHDVSLEQRWPLIFDEVAKTTKQNKGVIVLVPEVVMIPDVVQQLHKAGFADQLISYEKKLPIKQEVEQWQDIRTGQKSIVVGTRSAIFSPSKDLGLIIIFDEENGAYKQEQSPHYHVDEVAQMRSAIEQCHVMFVSSAPSAELWAKANKDDWVIKVLKSQRANSVQIVDMTNYNPRRSSILSFPLQNCIGKALEDHQKILLFMNRRGFSTLTQCNQCGHAVQCERCNVNLTFLFSKNIMICRHCNYKRELPKICPSCNGNYLRSMGTGIEKLESEVARIYPEVKVHHFDKESDALPEDANVYIGTQAILKRACRLKIGLVAMLNFDAEISRIDFRSAQKAFTLLVHLRQLATDKLLIQTRMTDNYCLKAIQNMNFDKFYQEELSFRKELGLPPSRHLVAIGLRADNEEKVFEQSKALFKRFEQANAKNIDISDPHPDVLPKLRDKYRYTILLKGKSLKPILSLAKTTLKDFKKKNVVVTVNVDP